ncbi:MAG: invasion associated locus B family protein [Rhizomicrobium sp.]
MKSLRRLSAFAVAASLALTPAFAQDAQQAARKPTGPQVIKTFGGWDVRCFPASTQAPCDIWEAIAFKKGGQLAVSVSTVYVPSQDRYLMQFIVPLGVDLAKGAELLSGSFTGGRIPFHHCDRIGCYFGIGNANNVVDALKNQETLKVRLYQFRGKSVDLTVPLKGFEEARTAMIDLAKQKAGKAPPAPVSGSPAP